MGELTMDQAWSEHDNMDMDVTAEKINNAFDMSGDSMPKVPWFNLKPPVGSEGNPNDFSFCTENDVMDTDNCFKIDYMRMKNCSNGVCSIEGKGTSYQGDKYTIENAQYKAGASDNKFTIAFSDEMMTDMTYTGFKLLDNFGQQCYTDSEDDFNQTYKWCQMQDMGGMGDFGGMGGGFRRDRLLSNLLDENNRQLSTLKVTHISFTKSKTAITGFGNCTTGKFFITGTMTGLKIIGTAQNLTTGWTGNFSMAITSTDGQKYKGLYIMEFKNGASKETYKVDPLTGPATQLGVGYCPKNCVYCKSPSYTVCQVCYKAGDYLYNGKCVDCSNNYRTSKECT